MGPDGHGPGVELTAAGLDPSGYRLATGAEDGSVKVWDAGSGQELKHCKSLGGEKGGKDDDEGQHGVIGLSFCEVDGERCIVVAGLPNRIFLLSVKIIIHTYRFKLRLICGLICMVSVAVWNKRPSHLRTEDSCELFARGLLKTYLSIRAATHWKCLCEHLLKGRREMDY